MKQVVQSMRHGTVSVLDTPVPALRGPGVLVQSRATLISAGTERATLDFARGSLLDKARSRPDLVRQVLEKVRRDGLVPTAQAALSRLERPLAPGYASAGFVLAVGDDGGAFAVGDRVACAGAGYATHADVNYVPKNLVVPIPRRPSGEWVGFDEASFTTLGAIALHGIRLARPELGDRAVVIGLGLIGLLAVQILRANGCSVMGVDLDSARCRLALQLGAESTVSPDDAGAALAAWTGTFGADLVVVAAASESSAPAVLAADLARDKGRIVAVGATGLDLPRRTLFQKELSVTVSRSYGPGRYDPQYEEHGHDYPLAHVRWTERENMRAFLGLLAQGSVDVRPLISHRFAIEKADHAYDVLRKEPALGIVLEYAEEAPAERLVRLTAAPTLPKGGGLSFIGAGNFAHGVLLPAAIKVPGVQLRGVVTASGLSARAAGDKFHFAYCTTSPDDVWNDTDTAGVIIATRHDAHASLVCRALDAGKAVFVEKPLCLTEEELAAIVAAASARRAAGGEPSVMVGFNRRFAPAVVAAREYFGGLSVPVNVVYRVNAGRVPATSWVAGSEGGGRVLGEVCHFVDLAAYLSGSPIVSVSAVRSITDRDDVMVTLRMRNGAIATVAYMVDGDRGASKERIELFGGGASGVIDDFRGAVFSGRQATRRVGGRWRGQDKGHTAEIAAFVKSVSVGAASPVPFEEALNSTRATFAILRALESGAPVVVEA